MKEETFGTKGRTSLLVLVTLASLCATMRLDANQGAEQQFDELSRKAQAAREAERLDEAIGFYRQAVQLGPDWSDGWWYLAALLYDQSRYSDARPALQRSLKLKPESGPGWALLGLCEYKHSTNSPKKEIISMKIIAGLIGILAGQE